MRKSHCLNVLNELYHSHTLTSCGSLRGKIVTSTLKGRLPFLVTLGSCPVMMEKPLARPRQVVDQNSPARDVSAALGTAEKGWGRGERERGGENG